MKVLFTRFQNNLFHQQNNPITIIMIPIYLHNKNAAEDFEPRFINHINEEVVEPPVVVS